MCIYPYVCYIRWIPACGQVHAIFRMVHAATCIMIHITNIRIQESADAQTHACTRVFMYTHLYVSRHMQWHTCMHRRIHLRAFVCVKHSHTIICTNLHTPSVFVSMCTIQVQTYHKVLYGWNECQKTMHTHALSCTYVLMYRYTHIQIYAASSVHICTCPCTYTPTYMQTEKKALMRGSVWGFHESYV